MSGTAGEIGAWIVRAGLEGFDQAVLLTCYCDRPIDAGVPLWRGSLGSDNAHPLIDSQDHR